MKFLATGNLLTGSSARPDLAIMAEITCKNNGVLQYNFRPIVSNWDLAGWIPIVSTFSGCAKAIVALAHTVCHLAFAIFDNNHRAHHWEETKLGFNSFFDGITEIIPLIGNIIRFHNYAKRVVEIKTAIEEKAALAPSEYSGHALLFTAEGEQEKKALPAAGGPPLELPTLRQVADIIANRKENN